ncbi:hypothetical protein GEMRC1_009197 [Eukaryota sp. GEM-RC1]
MDLSILTQLEQNEVPVDQISSALDKAFFGSDSEKIQERLQKTPTSNCTVVWDRKDLCFYCAQCSMDSTSAVCIECFIRGPHQSEGHDWRLLRVFSGRCDCGSEGIRPSGWCSAHSNPTSPVSTLPPFLHDTTSFFSTLFNFILVRFKRLTATSEDPVVDTILQWTIKVGNLHEGLRTSMTHSLSADVITNFLHFSVLPSETGQEMAKFIFSLLAITDFKPLLLHCYGLAYEDLIKEALSFRKEFGGGSYKDRVFSQFGVQLFTIADAALEAVQASDGGVLTSLFSALLHVISLSKEEPMLYSSYLTSVGGDIMFLLTSEEVVDYIHRHFSNTSLSGCLLQLCSTLCQEHRAFTYKRKGRREEHLDDPEVPDPKWSVTVTVQFLIFNIFGKLFGDLEDSLTDVARVSAESLQVATQFAAVFVEFLTNNPAKDVKILTEPVSIHLPAHRMLSYLIRYLNCSPVFPQVSPLSLAPAEFWLNETKAVAQGMAFASFVSAQCFKRNGVHPILEVSQRHCSFSLFRDFDLFFLQICAHVAIQSNLIDDYVTRIANAYAVWGNQVFNWQLDVDDFVERHIATASDFLNLFYRICVERIAETPSLQVVKTDLMHFLAAKDKSFSSLMKSLAYIETNKYSMIDDILADISLFRGGHGDSVWVLQA